MGRPPSPAGDGHRSLQSDLAPGDSEGLRSLTPVKVRPVHPVLQGRRPCSGPDDAQDGGCHTCWGDGPGGPHCGGRAARDGHVRPAGQRTAGGGCHRPPAVTRQGHCRAQGQGPRPGTRGQTERLHSRERFACGRSRTKSQQLPPGPTGTGRPPGVPASPPPTPCSGQVHGGAPPTPPVPSGSSRPAVRRAGRQSPLPSATPSFAHVTVFPAAGAWRPQKGAETERNSPAESCWGAAPPTPRPSGRICQVPRSLPGQGVQPGAVPTSAPACLRLPRGRLDAQHVHRRLGAPRDPALGSAHGVCGGGTTLQPVFLCRFVVALHPKAGSAHERADRGRVWTLARGLTDTHASLRPPRPASEPGRRP